MSLWCNGCPMCRRLSSEQQPDQKTIEEARELMGGDWGTVPYESNGDFDAAPITEESKHTDQEDGKSRSLSQCAGFCANQPENCNTMSLWCGGCPVCQRMLSEQTEESRLTDQEDSKSRSLSQCAGFCANQ